MVHDIEYESYPLYLTIRLDSTYPNFAVALNMFIHFDLSKYIYIIICICIYIYHMYMFENIQNLLTHI